MRPKAAVEELSAAIDMREEYTEREREREKGGFCGVGELPIARSYIEAIFLILKCML